MSLPCGKRSLTLVWCILECLFFSGILNGWTSLQEILKEEKYYLDHCNATLVAELNKVHTHTDIGDALQENVGLDNPFITVHEGVRYKCVLRRVLKKMTVAEYEQYKKSKIKPTRKPLHISDVYCDEQDEQLEFVVSLVIIIRNILMLPLGIFLDRYGTTQTRIIAM